MLGEVGNQSISVTNIAVRAGGNSQETKKWRPLLRRIKLAAVHLQSSNLIIGLRKGKEVDIKTSKGIIRLAAPLPKA